MWQIHRAVVRVAFSCAVACLFVTVASAQTGFNDNTAPSRSAGLTVVGMEFWFDGDAPSETEFTFDGLAFGVFYDLEPLLLTFVRGEQTIADDDKLVLTDFALSGWTALRPFGEKKKGRIDFFVPVGLESDFRRIKRIQDGTEIDAFEYTVVAAGVGLGFTSPLVNGWLSAKGLPYYGIANRSFGTDTDTSAILDVDVDWSSAPLNKRLGLKVGYSYRWQKWYSDAGDITGHSFDYIGKHHAIRLGLSF